MIRFFKIIATLEGISAIVLFFIAMPLKYIGGMLLPVKYAGWAHGVLFTVYIAAAILLQIKYRYNWKKFLIICLASIPPFGTFYIEWKYFGKGAQQA